MLEVYTGFSETFGRPKHIMYVRKIMYIRFPVKYKNIPFKKGAKQIYDCSVSSLIINIIGLHVWFPINSKLNR